MATATYRAMVARDDVDFELRDIDERILDILEEGRCTRKHLADLLDVSSEYVYQRVDLMAKLGLIEIIHDGFYEINYEIDDADAEVTDTESASPDLESVDDNLAAQAEAALEELDVPGRSEETESIRRDAIMWAWNYLRSEEAATAREIANATFDAYDPEETGYGPEDRYRGKSLWENCVRDGLKKLPGVEPHEGHGQGKWEFVEGDN